MKIKLFFLIALFSVGQCFASDIESDEAPEGAQQKSGLAELIAQARGDLDLLITILSQPEVKQRLANDSRLLQELIDYLLSRNVAKGRKWIVGYVDGLRKEYTGGIVGNIVDNIDKIIGRPMFPIEKDGQLGDSFSLQEWSQACYQGDERIIGHFLETDKYALLINSPDGANKCLSWAAFGYINGDEIEGFVPSIQGFRMLSEDPRVETNFLIEAGLGRVAFDEWLLQIADYKDEPEKQARLNELKSILEIAFTHPERKERADQLVGLKAHKLALRQAKEKRQVLKRKGYTTTFIFATGLAVTFGGLYYMFNKQGRNDRRESEVRLGAVV